MKKETPGFEPFKGINLESEGQQLGDHARRERFYGDIALADVVVHRHIAFVGNRIPCALHPNQQTPMSQLFRIIRDPRDMRRLRRSRRDVRHRLGCSNLIPIIRPWNPSRRIRPVEIHVRLRCIQTPDVVNPSVDVILLPKDHLVVRISIQIVVHPDVRTLPEHLSIGVGRGGPVVPIPIPHQQIVVGAAGVVHIDPFHPHVGVAHKIVGPDAHIVESIREPPSIRIPIAVGLAERSEVIYVRDNVERFLEVPVITVGVPGRVLFEEGGSLPKFGIGIEGI